MDERQQRIGENEALLRVVNEQMEALDARFGTPGPGELHRFVCECGSTECVERIELTIDEYRHVREDPATFAIVEGHERPDVERIVETTDRYAVIRKKDGAPADLAAEHR